MTAATEALSPLQTQTPPTSFGALFTIHPFVSVWKGFASNNLFPDTVSQVLPHCLT